MPLLEQLGPFLASRGCGTLGTDLFIGQLPERAGTCLAVIEYGGEPSIQTFVRPVLATTRFQVVSRSDSYPLARARVERAFLALDGYRGDAMPGIYWIEAASPPFRIGQDERLRQLVAFNCRGHLSHAAPVGLGGADPVTVGVGEGAATVISP